jgi:ABC-type multidrug transport system fused ATPase/permease subunit
MVATLQPFEVSAILTAQGALLTAVVFAGGFAWNHWTRLAQEEVARLVLVHKDLLDAHQGPSGTPFHLLINEVLHQLLEAVQPFPKVVAEAAGRLEANRRLNHRLREADRMEEMVDKLDAGSAIRAKMAQDLRGSHEALQDELARKRKGRTSEFFLVATCELRLISMMLLFGLIVALWLTAALLGDWRFSPRTSSPFWAMAAITGAAVAVIVPTQRSLVHAAGSVLRVQRGLALVELFLAERSLPTDVVEPDYSALVEADFPVETLMRYADTRLVASAPAAQRARLTYPDLPQAWSLEGRVQLWRARFWAAVEGEDFAVDGGWYHAAIESLSRADELAGGKDVVVRVALSAALRSTGAADSELEANCLETLQQRECPALRDLGVVDTRDLPQWSVPTEMAPEFSSWIVSKEESLS